MSDDARAWFAARIPAGWFVGPPEVTSDGDEMLVLGTLPDVELANGTPRRQGRRPDGPNRAVPGGDARRADQDRPRG